MASNRREYSQKYYQKNREKYLEQGKRWREANPGRHTDSIRRHYHGLTLADKAMMLEAQDACCYLCGNELILEEAVIDHDHRCCPEKRSCQFCRRGLSCRACNAFIGKMLDNPARLRRMADSLEIALALVEARLAAKPEQLTFLEP